MWLFHRLVLRRHRGTILRLLVTTLIFFILYRKSVPLEDDIQCHLPHNLEHILDEQQLLFSIRPLNEVSAFDYSRDPASPLRPQHRPYQRRRDRPVVSIITATRGVHVRFPETFHTVMEQTFQDFEWIHIYDEHLGDDKGIYLQIKELEKLDDRIKVLRNAPTAYHGCGGPRNIGIKNSRGDYIAILDADDMWEPTYLEKCIWFLETHPHLSMVQGHFVGIGWVKTRWDLGFEHGTELFKTNVLNVAMTIRKSAMHSKNGSWVLFDESMETGGEDWEYWVHLIEMGHYGYTIPEYLFWYRTSPPGKWSGLSFQTADVIRSKHPLLAQKGIIKQPRNHPDQSKQHWDTLAYLSPRRKKATRVPPVNSPPHAVITMDFAKLTTLEDSRAQMTLQFCMALVNMGWTLTILYMGSETAHKVRNAFEAVTPETYFLENFLEQVDFPVYVMHHIQTAGAQYYFSFQTGLGYHLIPDVKKEQPSIHIVSILLDGDTLAILSDIHQNHLISFTLVGTQQIQEKVLNEGQDVFRENVKVMQVPSKPNVPTTQLDARSHLHLPPVPILLFDATTGVETLDLFAQLIQLLPWNLHYILLLEQRMHSILSEKMDLDLGKKLTVVTKPYSWWQDIQDYSVLFPYFKAADVIVQLNFLERDNDLKLLAKFSGQMVIELEPSSPEGVEVVDQLSKNQTYQNVQWLPISNLLAPTQSDIDAITDVIHEYLHLSKDRSSQQFELSPKFFATLAFGMDLGKQMCAL